MKTHQCILVCLLAVMLCACDTTTREARRMVKQAELLADTLPDSTVRLIDSVLHMPVYFSERERMDMALLQAEALFGDHGQDISPVMDDDFFDSHDNLSPSPELERAATYFAQKKQYAKAAHAALYSGFVQQHYNEKEASMRSFKEAEQYGKLVDDSISVARARYKMGRMLYYDGNKQEAITILTGSEQGFGNRFAEKALATNMIAACYLLLGDYERTELFLQQSLSYAKKSNTDKVERKVLNNYAVFYQLQGEYGKAINHLKQIADKSAHSNSELLLYMNLGDVFMKNNELDSAKSYYKYVDSLLPTTNVKIETQFSAYDALSKYAKRLHNDSLTIHYCAKRESLLYEIMRQRQEQSIFRIQQQYDYESLQNEMNRKLIRKQRLITFIGLLAIIGLAALAISQIRLAKIRKQEAVTKANLFHFMQQNKELVESNMEHEKKALDTTQQL